MQCRAQCINSKEIQSWQQSAYGCVEWSTSKNAVCSIIQIEMYRCRMYWSNQLNVHDTKATDLNEASAWKWRCHEWIIDEFVWERATLLDIGDAPLHFGLRIDTFDINTYTKYTVNQLRVHRLAHLLAHPFDPMQSIKLLLNDRTLIRSFAVD